MANQLESRLIFQNTRDMLAQLGYQLNSAKMTPSFLRGEMAMSTSLASYHIPVLVNDQQNGTQFNTEKRLNLQDIFVTTEIGVFIAKPSSSTDTTFKTFTYENQIVFSTSKAVLPTLWNGTLSLTINNDTVLPAWDIQRNYFAPIQQQATNAYYATTGPAFVDSLDMSKHGYAPCEPNLVINGAANIQFNLNLPAAISTVDTNARIIVIQRGLLCQNCTTVK
jgi:hypothetical protein